VDRQDSGGTEARPRTVTFAGWLFVVTGCGGLVVAAWRYAGGPQDAHGLGDFAWAAGSGLLAAAGGTFVLRGRDWARWALVAWMAGHLVLGALHSAGMFLVHAAMFAPLLYVLFRPPAARYFRPAGGGSPPP